MSQIKYQNVYDKDTLIKNIIILKNKEYRNKLKLDSEKFLKKEINLNEKLNLSEIFN